VDAEIVWIPLPSQGAVSHGGGEWRHRSQIQHGYDAASPRGISAAQSAYTRVSCSCGYASEAFPDMHKTTNTHTLNLLTAHRAHHRAVAT
jgi:hypothetical protein